MSVHLSCLSKSRLWRLLLASLAVLVVMGIGPDPSAGVAATAQRAPTGDGDVRPELLVLRVYFRDHAERDLLASELGAAEVTTLSGFLTLYSDRATYNQLL